MYIGGVDTRGYHHLLWEIVDNSVDEVINGHAKRIEVTLDADHAGRHASPTTAAASRSTCIPKYKRPALELILCTLHAGGKFEQRQLQGLGRPARRRLVAWSTRSPSELDGHACAARASSTRRRSRAASRPASSRSCGADAQARHAASTSGPIRRSSASSSSSTPTSIRERLEAKSYLHRGLHDHASSDEATGETRRVPPPGRHRRLPAEARRASAASAPMHPQLFALERESDDVRARGRAAVDRGDRRAHPLVRQRHPDARPAARTRPASSRASSRRSAASSRRKQIQPRA